MPGEPRYTASLSRTQGRTGWSVIFRHPARGSKPTESGGLRVRRGLATREREEADRLIAELNQLLATPEFWTVAARETAARRFDARVVDIFYHGMEPEVTAYPSIRDAAIPLPDSTTSEYRRALLLGATGAGKTTLIRQLIGTDPTSERFPSTSTAKTTVHDIEVLMDDGPEFRAVVTFAPAEEIREHLNECISAAVLAAHAGADDHEVLRRLLNHVNQRFRFSYVLGNGPWQSAPDDTEDDDEELEATSVLPAPELIATNELLVAAVAQIKEISQRHVEALKHELVAREEDQRVVDEIFEEELDALLREDEAIHELADRLMDEIEERFDWIPVGAIRRSRQGWPVSWTFSTPDRAAFLEAIGRFASNYAPRFGSLLTPLVNGARVAGPFMPAWSGDRPSLVLYDGEGLGHTPKSATSVPTGLTRRIAEVDAVILVDSATQPMQAASVAAMRELVSTGNASKLLFVFTHFDGVRGDNLPFVEDRIQHVLGSAENVLAAIGEELGPFAERSLRSRLQRARYFVGGIQSPLSTATKAGARTIQQLTGLLQAVDAIVTRPKPAKARPKYDRLNLVLAVRAAAENFHTSWWPRLGLKFEPGVHKEHWTRVKALSRRLAVPDWTDEYDTLRPVADLKAQLQAQVYVLLQSPVQWTGVEPSDEEKAVIFDVLAESLSGRLLDLASARIRQDRAAAWQEAYAQGGAGSTFVRARIIADQVYDKAAPVPDVAPSPDRNDFLHAVCRIVEEVAAEHGAELV